MYTLTGQAVIPNVVQLPPIGETNHWQQLLSVQEQYNLDRQMWRLCMELPDILALQFLLFIRMNGQTAYVIDSVVDIGRTLNFYWRHHTQTNVNKCNLYIAIPLLSFICILSDVNDIHD